MTRIEEASVAVADFMKKALHVEQVRIIGVVKKDGTWDVETEVYEDNTFLKSVGLPTKIKDRNIYIVKLSESMEVESYECEGHMLTTG